MSRSIDDYKNRTYLHKSDLDDPRVLTIDVVTDDTMADGTVKAVAHFVEKDVKPLVLNMTNMRTLARIAGTKILDEWPGTEAEYFNDESIEFREERGAIRCRPVTSSPVPPAGLQPRHKEPVRSKPARSEQQASFLDLDEAL